MAETREKNPANRMIKEACCVLLITFLDGNERTFYSRDIDRKKDNLYYWMNHLRNLAEKKWAGTWEQWVIYRTVGGERIGDPIARNIAPKI